VIVNVLVRRPSSPRSKIFTQWVPAAIDDEMCGVVREIAAQERRVDLRNRRLFDDEFTNDNRVGADAHRTHEYQEE